MELTIDKFGRVVLPKKLREHLGVGPGLAVEAVESAEGVMLKPVRGESGLMMKDGILIMKPMGEGAGELDWNSLVENEREGRIRKIAGS